MFVNSIIEFYEISFICLWIAGTKNSVFTYFVPNKVFAGEKHSESKIVEFTFQRSLLKKQVLSGQRYFVSIFLLF